LFARFQSETTTKVGREGRETRKKKFLLQQELHEVVFSSQATSKPVLSYVIPTCAEKREIHYSAAAAAADGTQSCDFAVLLLRVFVILLVGSIAKEKSKRVM
jgi:hypothetical protein